MEETDKKRYILDQSNIEIEHVRSWPTKVMAFYVTINFGIMSAVIALQKLDPPIQLSYGVKTIITLIVFVLTFLMLYILCKSNKNYIIHRELQMDLQKKLFNDDERKEYRIPSFWFEKKECCNYIKYPGWLFYVCFVIIVTFLMVTGIFIIG
ncbi:MAG: hypothetical protein FJ264_15160 [Planctomycetes bacterium]|nr:hypothetical protein [Planctomycetota bacterium]